MAEPTADAPGRTGFRWGRALAVIAALAMVLLWIYVLTRRPPVAGRLDDPAFAVSAEPICATAVAAALALPPAYEADSPAQRSLDIAAGTQIYQDMVDDLTPLVPLAETRDGRMVTEWLGDWQIYVGDRADLAERIATDGDARIFVTVKEKRQITEPIDRFAEVNAMASCATPGDLG